MATILVADDDQLLRTILRDHLERADHEVLEAGDGIAAIDIALEERPEVLLLDVMMPLARGLEVVRRVRQTEGWHPVVVMISARTRVSDRLNALDAGADAYFEKPFEPDALLETVERLISDAPPARFVDVLGPVWTHLALDRLARDAVERRTEAPDPAPSIQPPVEALFADIVAGSLGSAAPGLGPTGPAHDAVRLLWEDAIRGLLRDASEPVPVVTAVSTPDALAAVERVIGDETLRRHRAHMSPTPGLDALWSDLLSQSLAPPRPSRSDAPAPPESEWTRRLRAVLDDPAEPAEVERWTGVLRDVLAAEDPTSRLDPLQTLWLLAAEQSLRVRAER